MDFLVSLVVIHLVGGKYEVIDQVPIPEPSTAMSVSVLVPIASQTHVIDQYAAPLGILYLVTQIFLF
jgi:hypothetical protein